MDRPTTPYREGKPLDEIIAPDRRRRTALTLIATSMIAGAALWAFGGALIETASLAAEAPTTTSGSADVREAFVIAAKKSSATRASQASQGSELEKAREAALVREACKQHHDSACVDDIKAKYR